MTIPQLPLFTDNGAGIDDLNKIVQFINQLWRFVYSFLNGPSNLFVFNAGPINMTPDMSVVIVNDMVGVPVTLNLPLLPYVNEKHTIKDGSGNAGSANLTIQGGGILIDGQSSYTIGINYGAITMVYDGTNWDCIA